MIKSTDLAYAAGYTDGDGCFHVGKIHSENRIRYRSFFVINTTELENVQWFQAKFGGTISTKPRRKSNHKIIYRYVLKGKNVDVVDLFSGFLQEKYYEWALFKFFRQCSIESKDGFIEEIVEHRKFSNLFTHSIKKTLESLRKTIKPSIEDFAYLAGFIDAECCINIQKSSSKSRPNPTYKIQLQCNNTKSPTFIWIAKRFGGQFHFIDRSKYRNHRNQMTWRLSAAELYPVLEGVLPFLIHKKPVCEELIKFQKTIVPLNGVISRNSPKFGEFYQPILEERERIFHKIQALNKKGI